MSKTALFYFLNQKNLSNMDFLCRIFPFLLLLSFEDNHGKDYISFSRQKVNRNSPFVSGLSTHLILSSGLSFVNLYFLSICVRVLRFVFFRCNVPFRIITFLFRYGFSGVMLQSYSLASETPSSCAVNRSKTAASEPK